MVLTLEGLTSKIIQLGLDDEFDIMKSIGHGMMESATNIFNTKGKLHISECSLRPYERSIMLICLLFHSILCQHEVIL